MLNRRTENETGTPAEGTSGSSDNARGQGDSSGPVNTRIISINDAEKNIRYGLNAQSNTKYTLITFIPRNLMEQFSRAMNRYFLVIACLQLVSTITPVNPLTTWLPLIVIFAITAIKEGIDDIGRYKSDKIANSRPYVVLRDGERVTIPSGEIRVGDLLYLQENDEVPADAVLISSSDPNGNCSIQTTNLDGESNLKLRSSLSCTKSYVEDHQLRSFHGLIEAPLPNEHVYRFDAQLRKSALETGTPFALTSSQLLLQATHIRNTEWLWCVVVYTGNETKFGKNKRQPPTKYTQTDAFINRVSAVIFVFQLILVIIFGIVGDVYTNTKTRNFWYMDYSPDYPFYNEFIIPARFLLLNSTMIPISLKVTIDLCKLFYAKFINYDVNLENEETGEPANSNSTALSEDLGQVRYILTDKTGTLTENRMVVKVAVVGTTEYGSPDGSVASNDASLVGAKKIGCLRDMEFLSAVREGNTSVTDFLRCMALNNDVIPAAASSTHGEAVSIEVDGDTLPIYKASSPDEEALVKLAAAYRVILAARSGDDVHIIVNAKRESYEQIACFEFDSDRKRMSVLLHDKRNNSYRLYTKGADDTVFPLLSRTDSSTVKLLPSLTERITAHAQLGLRTLVYCYRDLSQEEFRVWKAQYDVAAAALTDRDAAKERVYALLESNLILLGSTAIEDKLQEGVPETIALLRKAGVRFWMLTGDKFSTACTIAETSRLKAHGTEVVEVPGETAETAAAGLKAVISRLTSEGRLQSLPADAKGQFLLQLLEKSSNFRGPVGNPGILLGASQSDTSTSSSASEESSGKRRSESNEESAPIVKSVSLTNVRTNPLRAASIDVIVDAHEARGSSSNSTVSNYGSIPVSLNTPGPFTIIVRGATLDYVLHGELRNQFASVCLQAESVICCRVTPKQKAQLVRLVRDRELLTLAIGDGGNDVAMIQEAAVGVGICGKEGLQASRAADYKVHFFRALQRLLLIHGRYSYYRTAVVAQYSFYKSFMFCIMQICYGFFSGYAGVSLFNSMCVAAYNAVLFVPIVFFLVDRDVCQETALRLPESYVMNSNGRLLNKETMFVWLLRGVWQAVMCLLLCMFAINNTKSADYESAGLLVFIAYMFIQDFTMFYALRRVTVRNIVSIFGMHLLAFIVAIAANSVFGMMSFVDYKSFNNTIADPAFWLLSLLTTAACILPVQAWDWWNANYGSSEDVQLIRKDREIEASILKHSAGSAVVFNPLAAQITPSAAPETSN